MGVLLVYSREHPVKWLLILTFTISFGDLAQAQRSQSEYLQKCARSKQLINYGSNPDNLSTEEIVSLYDYTYETFSEINKALWTQPEASWSSCHKLTIDRLDSALSKISPTKGTFFRGTEYKHYRHYQVGDVLELRGYTSVSFSEEAASYFIRDAYFIIESQEARDISPYHFQTLDGLEYLEKELLLPRGTKLKIQSISQKMMTINSEHVGNKQELVWVFHFVENK